MSNWYGAERSNYFKVKDPVAFKVWAEQSGMSVSTSTAMGIERYALLPSEYIYDGSLSPCRKATAEDINNIKATDPDTDLDVGDTIEVPIIAELSKFLTEDTVVVIMGSGAEKIRYITGFAYAFDHTGKFLTLDLWDIYNKAAELFPDKEITAATY